MKKMLLSLMLIVSMFAFAAESAPSATVGYVKYSNIATAGTDNNHIAVALNGQWTSSNQIDPTGVYYNKISRWNPATQLYQSSSFLGSWLTPFAISYGDPLVVTMKTGVTSHDLINSGSLSTVQYNLVTTAGTDLNHIMLPLGKSNLTSTTLLGPDIGNTYINKISKWNATTQLYTSSSFLGSWLTPFNTYIGDHLVVNSTNAKTWPTVAAKDEDVVGRDWSESDDPKAGESRPFFILVNDGGSFYSYPGDEGVSGAKITWYVWISERPTQIIRWNTAISTPPFMDVFGDGNMSITFDIQEFAGTWAAGNTLNVIIKSESTGNQGQFSWVLDADTSPTAFGFNTTYPGMDYPTAPFNAPLPLTSPSSIEDDMLPTVTKLHQNYPNPFNPTTTIKFDLAQAGNVQLNVYNYSGQLVKALVNGEMKAGFQRVDFDASSLAAGVYYYTMQTAGKTMTHKMVLIK